MALITSYNPLPISFTHGKGVYLYDTEKREYLDGLSGIAVCGLGHAHPDVTKTIQEQASKLLHSSNAFIIPEQQALAEKLTQLTASKQVFFSNSGAEANEAAIKLSRLFGHKKAIATPSIIVMENAFHGRTMATLTASGSLKGQEGYQPLLPGFIRAPFNDIQALHAIANTHSDIVAIMLEPIQGEGGLHPADKGYLEAVSALCQERDYLLILDEIQTGNGRTGKPFAYMHTNIQPDILTTAKGLGNGIPIGACMMNTRACDLFKPGNHGSTFGGNQLACATALTVLKVIERDKLCQNAAKQGQLLKELLIKTFSGRPGIVAIRGHGLMLGIELDRPASDTRLFGLKHGLLFNITAEKVVRLLPPLIITEAQVRELVKRLDLALTEFLASSKSNSEAKR